MYSIYQDINVYISDKVALPQSITRHYFAHARLKVVKLSGVLTAIKYLPIPRGHERV